MGRTGVAEVREETSEQGAEQESEAWASILAWPVLILGASLDFCFLT